MKKNYLIAGVIVLLAVAFGAYVSYSSYTGEKASFAPGVLDGFVQCIKSKGIIFYGAYWCPHCQATKAMFGSSAKELPYVECSTPDGQGQTQVCIDKKVQEYPTWILADGSRISGQRTLGELATSFSCPLPDGIAASSATSSDAASPAK
jgi:thiol-disulfide isomerase/thioredoxin